MVLIHHPVMTRGLHPRGHAVVAALEHDDLAAAGGGRGRSWWRNW